MRNIAYKDIPPIPQFNPHKKEDLLKVASELKDQKDIETQHLMISFRFYNKKVCDLEKIDKKVTKKTLKKLRDAGSCNWKDLKNNGFSMKDVVNVGEYSELFANLPPDTEMKEEYIGYHERLFYFVTEQRYFNIVALKNKHYRIDKNSN